MIYTNQKHENNHKALKKRLILTEWNDVFMRKKTWTRLKTNKQPERKRKTLKSQSPCLHRFKVQMMKIDEAELCRINQRRSEQVCRFFFCTPSDFPVCLHRLFKRQQQKPHVKWLNAALKRTEEKLQRLPAAHEVSVCVSCIETADVSILIHVYIIKYGGYGGACVLQVTWVVCCLWKICFCAVKTLLSCIQV